jgi:DNA-binding XRE family transcriptional regulator
MNRRARLTPIRQKPSKRYTKCNDRVIIDNIYNVIKNAERGVSTQEIKDLLGVSGWISFRIIGKLIEEGEVMRFDGRLYIKEDGRRVFKIAKLDDYKSKRKDAGLTIKELTTLSGVSHTTIYKLEQGYAVMDKTLAKIDHVLEGKK